jgi:exonuclease VII large subunit
LVAQVENYKNRISTAALSFLNEQQNLLSSLISTLRYVSPDRRIQSERQRVDELSRRVYFSLLHRIQLQSIPIQGMQRRLEALNPLAVLRRGFAVVTRKEDGNVVSRVAQVRPGEKVTIRVSDGQVNAEIENRKS